MRLLGSSDSVAGRQTLRWEVDRPTLGPRGGRCGSRVRAHREVLGQSGVVLRHVAVANQRRDGPADGAATGCVKAARPDRARSRRHARLSASRGVRTGPTIEARGGNDRGGRCRSSVSGARAHRTGIDDTRRKAGGGALAGVSPFSPMTRSRSLKRSRYLNPWSRANTIACARDHTPSLSKTFDA